MSDDQSPTPPMSVSLIGTGNMGNAMARGLINAGHRVTVWNRTREKAEALREIGATVALSAADAVRASDHVIVLFNDVGPARSVLLDDEVKAALRGRELALSVAMTPEDCLSLVADLRAAGCRPSDVQVTTFPEKVEARDSEILLGCDAQDKESWRNLFASVASRLHDVGDVGNACKAQLGIAMSGAFLTSAMAYSVAAFAQMGLPAEVLRALLTHNPSIRIPEADSAVPEMFGRNYPAGPWPVSNMIPMIDWLLDTAQKLEIEQAPLVAIRNLYQKAEDKGFGDRHITSVYEVVNPRKAEV